mgnify:CR=1 FL=1
MAKYRPAQPAHQGIAGKPAHAHQGAQQRSQHDADDGDDVLRFDAAALCGAFERAAVLGPKSRTGVHAFGRDEFRRVLVPTQHALGGLAHDLEDARLLATFGEYRLDLAGCKTASTGDVGDEFL